MTIWKERFGVACQPRRRRAWPDPNPTGIEEIDEGSERTSVLPNASVRWRASETLQLTRRRLKTRTLPSFARP
jgi:hypothetical protein